MTGINVIYRSASKGVLIEPSSNKMINKIMQPFFTTKKGTQGTGLGLSITNDIIKAHRGKLEIKSNPKVLTCFIITLPIV